jgi:hypothetical protein
MDDDVDNKDDVDLSYKIMVNRYLDYVCHNELEIYIFLFKFNKEIKIELRFLPRSRFPHEFVEDV